MPMPRTKHFFIALSLLLVASIADMLVTLHFSPSLSREANPLVSDLGLGKAGLVAWNLLVLGLIGIALVAYRKGPRVNLRDQAEGPWELAGLTLFNKPTTPTGFYVALLFSRPLPTDWRQLVRLGGFITAWGVIAARTASVVSWFLLYSKGWSSFKHFRYATEIAGHPTFELLIGLLTAVAMIQVFVYSEFRLEQQKVDPLAGSPAR